MNKQVIIKINKKAIKEQCFIKYLGVLIDSKLSWKHHVSKMSKTISRSLGIMYKLRPFLPLKIMKNVYYSLIYSHLVYGIEVWGSACKTELNKLLVLQCLLQLTPSNFHSWFTASSVIHNYRTRSNFNIEFNSDSKNLFIPSARTTNYVLKQISVSGPKIWNDLPYWIKNNTSLYIFFEESESPFAC